MKKNLHPSKLALLTASALALPAISQHLSAAGPTTTSKIKMHTGRYQEEDIQEDKTLSANRGRYDVDIGQFYLLTPAGDSGEFTLNLAYEKMSGASPWFTLPGLDGEAVQIMSGATIADQRTDTALSYKHFWKSFALQFNAGLSDEDDYRAKNLGISLHKELNNSLTELALAFAYSRDKLQPSDSEQFLDRVESADKYLQEFGATLTQVINTSTIVQSSLNYERQWGFLSDPYKVVFVGNNILPDTRPDTRHAVSFTTDLRHYVDAANAAVKVKYRWFSDSWGVNSHTLGLQWHQNLPGDWAIIPSLRVYSQSQANFFDNTFSESSTDTFHSSDYRLSAYGARSIGLEVRKKLGNFALGLSYKKYRSAAEYSFSESAIEAPGLVDFSLLSLKLEMEFL